MSILHTIVKKLFLCEMEIEVKLDIPLRKVDKHRVGANFNGTMKRQRKRKIVDFSNHKPKLQNSTSNQVIDKGYLEKQFYPLISITDNFFHLLFLWNNCAITCETRSFYEKVVLPQYRNPLNFLTIAVSKLF